jgi:hypothetical protein
MKKSHRGQNVDLDKLVRDQESAIAVGNMHVNAKGDRIGKNGQVEETAAQRAKIFYKTASTTSKTSSLKSDFNEDKKELEKATLRQSSSAKVEELQDNGDIVVKEKGSKK